MPRRAFPLALLAACLTTGCSGPSKAPRAEPTSPSPSATSPSATRPAEPSATSSLPPPVVERTDHRDHPFETVDLQGRPATYVDTDGLAVGAPPGIPWSEPRGLRYVYRVDGEVLPVPRTLLPVGRFGDAWAAEGGCTRSRCSGGPRDGIHLVSQDGTVSSVFLTGEGEQACCLTVSLDGRHLAWVVESGRSYRPYRFTEGDQAPTELADPAAGTRRAFPRPVGFAGDDLVLAVARSGGRPIGYVRTSGRRAEWDARSLRVVAAGALLGDPAFTPERSTCLSRYRLESARPRWTRCYTWDGRPAELGPTSSSDDGRWLVGTVTRGGTAEVVLVDLRTGDPARRIAFDHRPQQVRFEDDRHFLAVLSREDLPGPDPWPVGRIVRCDLEAGCERATPDIDIQGYDMLGLLGG